MALSETTREKLNWLFLESVLIVLSILLAFWIDAWWDRSQQNERQDILLESLLTDLQAKAVQVELQRRYNEGIQENAVSILLAGESEASNLDSVHVDNLIGGIIWSNPPRQWESAPLVHMVDGGELSIFDDTKLIEKLNQLHILFEDVQNTYETGSRFNSNRLIPFLIGNSDYAQILNSIKKVPGLGETYDSPLPDLRRTQDHAELLFNAEFRSLVAAKTVEQHFILVNTLPDLKNGIEETIELLEAKLSE